ncbi:MULTISPECIES: hypothetical protein [Pseudomonas]|uniref:hypothetical protein n=1 Tax=Pseudomonas TaxID=286 RepID=UPI0006743A77|nr:MULTISPECIES: hypothetical protein [Pseudomonas]ANI32590.1 hypothetical protein AA098_03355 [Pseudomonas sp. JY-Q]MCK2191082.1 hypothetical protein [Pseudomonas sp. MB04B]MDD2088485.1 hypothetical protein [Pseudomonas putida]MDD2098459.1 hypothetical protein [Pseudomonas putida]
MIKRRAPLSTSKTVNVSPSAMPRTVAKAMRVEFEREVTAYLSSVEYGPHELFLRGVVFGDRERRFDDGDSIRTSNIVTYEDFQGYVVARTLNSTYVVCDWAADGARGGTKAQH